MTLCARVDYFLTFHVLRSIFHLHMPTPWEEAEAMEGVMAGLALMIDRRCVDQCCVDRGRVDRRCGGRRVDRRRLDRRGGSGGVLIGGAAEGVDGQHIGDLARGSAWMPIDGSTTT